MGDPSARRRAAAQRMRDDISEPWYPAPAWHGPALACALVAVSVFTAVLAWSVLP